MSGSKALFHVTNEIWFRVQSSQKLSCYLHDGTGYGNPAETTATIAAEQPDILFNSFDGSVIRVQIGNGTVATQARAITINNTSTTALIGNTGGSTDMHVMSELLVYDRVLNASEIARVKSYLTNKWGIA